MEGRGSMFNYPGEYFQLPWGVCSTTLGSMFNYPGEYVSTTLGSKITNILKKTKTVQCCPEEIKKHRARAFRGHETARGLHMRGEKLRFRREWRRSETQTIDFCNRKLKKGTHPRIPSDPADPVRGLLLGTSRPHAPGVRMT